MYVQTDRGGERPPFKGDKRMTLRDLARRRVLDAISKEAESYGEEGGRVHEFLKPSEVKSVKDLIWKEKEKLEARWGYSK